VTVMRAARPAGVRVGGQFMNDRGVSAMSCPSRSSGFACGSAFASVVGLTALLLSRAAIAAPLPGFVEWQVVRVGNATSMAFAQDGTLFISEQAGSVRVIRSGALLPVPFAKLKVETAEGRGLLGIAVDPSFATNPYIYVYYTAATPTVHNRVSRLTANGDVAAPGSELVLLDIPYTSTVPNHNGGGLRFANDGKLLVGVGDHGQSLRAQSLDSLLGKVLRMNADGGIPTDNPFYQTATGSNRLIWALGFRDPTSIDVDPQTGLVFINDVGPTSREEVNEGVAGGNYGWPTVVGPDGAAPLKSPFHSYPWGQFDACAITGGAFYRPPVANFPPEFVGQYFFSDLCGNWIDMLKPGDPASRGRLASGTEASPVDIEIGPDGALYYLTYEGRLSRIQIPAVALSAAEELEGEATGLLTFTVTMPDPLATDVRVHYQTSDGTAIAGSDYTATSGDVTIPAGFVTRTFVVPTLGDTVAEPDETFTVTLSNAPPGMRITNGSAAGTIKNDDPPVALTAADAKPMYRLYHTGTKEHLYTTDPVEYGALQQQGWLGEGVPYKVFTKTGTYGGISVVPFYRLYLPAIKQHHWTPDFTETQVLSSGQGRAEGIVGYLLPPTNAVPGTVKLYRMVMNTGTEILHLWTTSELEYDTLPATGWVKEGVVAYVLAP